MARNLSALSKDGSGEGFGGDNAIGAVPARLIEAGLKPGVANIVSYSPAFLEVADKFERAGGKFRYDHEHDHTYFDDERNEIVFGRSPARSDTEVAYKLAHELKHPDHLAELNKWKQGPHEGEKIERDAWVNDAMNSRSFCEGDACFFAEFIRDEIIANRGPQIGNFDSMRTETEVPTIYRKLISGEIDDPAEAIKQMGDAYVELDPISSIVMREYYENIYTDTLQRRGLP
ncbi:hypothetical protein [Nocardia sp. NPDC004750]